jgi:hypothetical protein
MEDIDEKLDEINAELVELEKMIDELLNEKPNPGSAQSLIANSPVKY